MLSAERAGQLAPGGATQLAAGARRAAGRPCVPAPVFTMPAVCSYLADAGTSAADADRAWEAVRALADTGLLTIDSAPAPPVVRMSRLVAALVRAVTPEQVLEQASVAAADALLETWPQAEPRPWLAAGMRIVRGCPSANRRRQAVGGRCLPPAAGQSRAAASTAPDYAARPCATGPTTTKASDRILGSDSPHTLTAGSHLAHALLTAGQAAQATAWWQWVVGLPHPHVRPRPPQHPHGQGEPRRRPGFRRPARRRGPRPGTSRGRSRAGPRPRPPGHVPRARPARRRLPGRRPGR